MVSDLTFTSHHEHFITNKISYGKGLTKTMLMFTSLLNTLVYKQLYQCFPAWILYYKSLAHGVSNGCLLFSLLKFCTVNSALEIFNLGHKLAI